MNIDRNYIAKKAGVSTATVSRVFNDPKLVGADKVEAVLTAAKKYGYYPNKMASALRRSGTGVIGFVENSVTGDTLPGRNFLWIYAYCVKAAQRTVESSMYQLGLFSLGKNNQKTFFEKKHCDGILTCGLELEYIKKIKASGIPYIVSYRNVPGDYNIVYVDEVEGGRIAGRHLLDTGHRKFAHINASVKWDKTSEDRYLGFKEVVGDFLHLSGNYGIRGGYEQGLELVKEIRAGAVDSVFVLNDLTASGVIQALMEKGVRIPEDVSIIGYDNMPYIETLPVKLSTIEIPVFETYKTAAETLLRIMKKKENIRIAVVPKFIPGNTVLIRR